MYMNNAHVMLLCKYGIKSFGRGTLRQGDVTIHVITVVCMHLVAGSNFNGPVKL